MKKWAGVNQKKLIYKKRRRVFYISLYSLVVFGLILSVLSYLSRIDAFFIETISVRGNMRLHTQDIEALVNTYIAGNYVGFFSKANAFLYPRSDIKNALYNIHLIKKADVSRSGFNTIVVSLDERDEIAVWCGGIKKTCFSIDENGLLFGALQNTCQSNICDFSSATNTRFIYEGLLSGNPLGQYFLPTTDFKKIDFFIHSLETLMLEPVRASISSTTGYMTVVLSSGGEIIVNTDDDLSEILQNISVVLKDQSVAPSFSTFLQKLEYIKFDTGNKVVYKLKNTKSDKAASTR